MHDYNRISENKIRKGQRAVAIKLKKERFADIENAFKVLKEDPKNRAGMDMIKKALDECFGYEFRVDVIPCNIPEKGMFVMSVFPEVSTMDKIISALMSDNKNKLKVINSLWQKNKVWTIEIDERILTDSKINANERELTALLMHEVGHIACSNALPSRIVTILQYEIAKTNMRNKMLLKDKMFGKILCLPILNACIADDKGKAGLKREIDADSFAKKMGYKKDLISVLKKMTKVNPEAVNANDDPKSDNMKELAKFSADTVEALRTRQDNLVKNNLLTIKNECTSPFVESFVEYYHNAIFQENENIREKILERAYNLGTDECICEKFGPRKLARIDRNEIDYIEVKMGSIQSDLDKMMLVSYCNDKLDLVNYYIHVVEDPMLSQKYVIPHTYQQLSNMKSRLEKLRIALLNYRIPVRQPGLLVQWPTGYEG